ncbi:MAG: hypothetical protein Q9159_000598 [Coniocarpon cinnabarinum]
MLALLSLATLLPLALALPTTTTVDLVKRAPSQCSQYGSISTGAFTLYANEWGASTAGTTGSQCSYITGLANGNSLQWYTTWTWANNPTQVKSYTNAEVSLPQKAISQYTSIPTTWSWSYAGTNLSCNVAYDTFLGASANGANQFEVMVWLGLYGSISPLSANGYPFTPIASPTINGVPFDLAYGLNGNVKVYSFVAHSRAATTFNGDILAFYKYLVQNYASNGFTNSLVLQSLQAGSEVFTGSNAKLTTSGYTISAS